MCEDNLLQDLRFEADGLGSRRIEHDVRHGKVERLELIPALATIGAEQAIRARAARLAQAVSVPVVPVHRIDREGDRLVVTGDVAHGITLSDILVLGGRLRAGRAWPALPLAAAIVRAVASLHDHAPSLSHGAIVPSRLVLTCDGSFMLRDAVYGAALERLQWNREQLWKQFGLALPAAAGVLRFDRRADTTQMAAAVLAVLLQRHLREDDYPGRAVDLVTEATQGAEDGRADLRPWLNQALQLHPRASFGSAGEAYAAFEHQAPKGPVSRLLAHFVQRMLGSGEGR